MARAQVSLSGANRPRIVTVSTVAHGDTLVVQLHGDHDCSNTPTLAATLASAVARERTNLIVDLSEVQFINAATLRVLTAAGEFVSGEGRTFALRSPSRSARRILDLCGARGLCEPEGT
ncbi:MAG: STAS domain-containing protein [Acidimicrobiales bacterium]